MENIIQLNTLIKCSCGEVARIVGFNKSERLLTFKCQKGHETVKIFDEVENTTNQVEEFILSSNGEIAWKCSQHGNCDSYVDEDTDFEAYYAMDEGCPFCRMSERILHPYYKGEVKLKDEEELKDVMEQLSELFNGDIADNELYSADESEIEIETKEEVEAYILGMVKRLEDIAKVYPEIEVDFKVRFCNELDYEMGCAPYEACITKEQREIKCKWSLTS